MKVEWVRPKPGDKVSPCFSDSREGAKRTDQRLKSIRIGTFEEEDFKEAFAKFGRVCKMGVKWESRQYVEC